MNAALSERESCALRAATGPPEADGRRRDDVRLLVSTSHDDQVTAFRALPDMLRPGDLVVLNTSATRKSAIDVPGTRLTVHLSSRTRAGDWIVEFRSDGGRRPHGGPVPTRLHLAGGIELRVNRPHNDDEPTRLWRADLRIDDAGVDEWLERVGRWIRYDYVDPGGIEDTWYRNVYATDPGSAEMPSAGRPLTHDVLEALQARGVAIADLVLHCGVSSQENGESPHAERYRVPRGTVDAVLRTRADGGRVIAVGTTVVRALETVARTEHLTGFTGLVLRSSDSLAWIDGILSGFHPPEASHLDLLAAVAGSEVVDRAYAAACRAGFLSHEFGDSHLLFAAT